ncbi:hypothetical protein [Aquimarina sp. 433]
MKIIFLILLITIASIQNSKACSCLEKDESLVKKVREAYYDADLIFTGKVIDVKDVNPNSTHQSSSDPIIYTFEIIQKYKGDTKKHYVQILSSKSEASCGYNFKLGESYLVYSGISRYFSKKANIASKFATSLCRRNRILENVNKKELELLKQLYKLKD